MTDIQKIDPDWWLVKNAAGQVTSPSPSSSDKILTFLQTGLVPSNYLQEMDDDDAAPTSVAAPVSAAPEPTVAPTASQGATATALYEYEAGEDNELSFPEDAVITNIVRSSESTHFQSLTSDTDIP